MGIAGTLDYKSLKAFQQLLIIDGLRGTHSTGVAGVTRERNEDDYSDVFIHKTVETPYEFVDDYRYKSVVDTKKLCLIGHNRYRTVGASTSKNAHPYYFQNLVGAHNGTLTNKHSLEKHALFNTDSAALYYNIANKGAEKVIPEIKGAWALTWYDLNQDKLFFLRNKERPLHMCFSKDYKTLFWASEAGMLSFILKRDGIEIPFTKIKQLKENTLVSLTIPEEDQPFTDDHFYSEKLEGQPAPKPTTYHHMSGGGSRRQDTPNNVSTYYQGKWGKWRNGTFIADTPTAVASKGGGEANTSVPKSCVITKRKEAMQRLQTTIKKPLTVCDLFAWLDEQQTPGKDKHYKGYKGRLLDEKGYREATKSGCCWCGTTVEVFEPVRFLSSESFVCMECNSIPDVAEMIGEL